MKAAHTPGPTCPLTPPVIPPPACDGAKPSLIHGNPSTTPPVVCQ